MRVEGLEVTCPHCGETAEAPAEMAGQTTKRPMVSYERAAAAPDILCRSIAEFCGISDSSLIDTALENLSIDRLAYLGRESQS